MVLLDLLRKRSGISLTVAHFDHGIRDDSAQDRLLVRQIATQHGLPFVEARGQLGKHVSEAAAREARYNFLKAVAKATLMPEGSSLATTKMTCWRQPCTICSEERAGAACVHSKVQTVLFDRY